MSQKYTEGSGHIPVDEKVTKIGAFSLDNVKNYTEDYKVKIKTKFLNGLLLNISRDTG